jgi:spore coat protein U-like protein
MVIVNRRGRGLSRAAATGMIVFLAGVSQEAEAATATANVAVTATVLSICSVAASPLAFGNYDPTSGTPKDATADITATCTPGISYTLTLDDGTTPTGSFNQRQMAGSSETLGYNLYTANDYGTVWGDGGGSTGDVTDTGNGTGQIHTVYGRIPETQYVASGAYSDTVQVTLTY